MSPPAPVGDTVKKEPSRWTLYAQAVIWRFLMGIMMFMNKIASPRPDKPRFVKYIDTTLASAPGRVRLVFYTPKDYGTPGKKFPCIVNFHGGGFMMGSATDDCRWATAVCEQAETIVCSVDYRRAPEYPFPTAVEDGADAVMWVWDNADELGIDGDRIGLSGFSAGGNMSFTVPLRLQDALLRRRASEDGPPDVSSDAPGAHGHRTLQLIVAWYPPTDRTRTREERSSTNPRLDKRTPPFIAEMLDASYLHPSKEIKLDSPYLSPGVAADDLLKLLPEDILLYTCEWDDLLAEEERFRDRLLKLGKTLKYRMVEKVPHGWNLSPNPFKTNTLAEEMYAEACKEIKRVFYESRSLAQETSD